MPFRVLVLFRVQAGNGIQLQRRAENLLEPIAFQTKVKGLDGKKIVVISKGSWDCKNPKRCHIYVANHLSLTAKQIMERYSLRWRIEMTFRDLKEFCYFDHYQVRSFKAITRHWHFAFVAYAFLLNCKLKGCFILKDRPS